MLPSRAGFHTLYDKNGLQMPAGKYYHDEHHLLRNLTINRIERGRAGVLMLRKLLDGTHRRVSTWDNVNRAWELAALGKTFYSKAVDRYTVLWPLWIQLTRIQPGRYNSTIFERENWMPSTVSDSIGEIEVPRNLSETMQRQRAAQIERQWRNAQPTIEGDKCFCLSTTRVTSWIRHGKYNTIPVRS